MFELMDFRGKESIDCWLQTHNFFQKWTVIYLLNVRSTFAVLFKFKIYLTLCPEHGQ